MSLAMFLLFPLYGRQLGLSDLAIGLLLGCGQGASVVARPLVGAALDRFGRRRVLLASGALNAASFVPFLVLRVAGPALAASVVLHCIVWGALFAGYFTYAADLVPAGRRAEGIAVFGVAGMVSNGAGPSLGEAVIAHGGFTGLFLVAIGFALLSLSLTASVPVRGADAPGRRPHGGGTWRVVADGRLGSVVGATVLFGVGVNAAFFFVAPYTRDVGIARAAPFFIAYATTSIVLRLFGRRLLDRYPSHRVAMPAFAAIALGLGVLALLPHANVLVPAGMVCGAGHGTLFPVLNALALDRTPSRLYGAVVSVMTGALDLGGVVGTPLCGAIAQAAGYPVMFAVMALASASGVAALELDRRRTHAVAPARSEG